MRSYQRYIDKHKIELRSEFLQIEIDPTFFVVIPCYDEADFLNTLISLNECLTIHQSILVVVLINSSINAPIDAISENKKTIRELEKFRTHFLNFELLWMHITDIPLKKAGVGFARKFAMDQVIAFCAYRQLENTIILSLDADTLVEKNYFREIDRLFSEHLKLEACSVYFEHPIEGNLFTPEIYTSIIEYELHLRYYKNAIRYTGFNNYFYTIGSCFAVRADAYIKYGGMNQQKAGEDFYFLSKIFPNKQYAELNTTTVIPSPRPSMRVPFGTGPTVNELSLKNNISFLSFEFEAFIILKTFFAQTDLFYQQSKSQLENLLSKQHETIIPFLREHQFTENILEINRNIGSLEAFRKRYFNWFNAFKILKFLNFTHENIFKKSPVNEEAFLLLSHLGISIHSTDSKELLTHFRKIDKQNLKFN